MKQPMIRKPYVKKQEVVNISSKPLKINDNYDNLYQNSKFEAQNIQQDLVPCRKCGRKFNSDRVGKHEKVCKESAKPIAKVQQKNNIINSPMKPSMVKKKGPLD